MKEEPDIVKELKEEERLGKLNSKKSKIFYFQDLEEEESEDENTYEDIQNLAVSN